jgi:PHP family Zn ribbon phosphoesterase
MNGKIYYISCPRCGKRFYHTSTSKIEKTFCECGAYYENGIWYESPPLYHSDGRVELNPIKVAKIKN